MILMDMFSITIRGLKLQVVFSLRDCFRVENRKAIFDHLMYC